MQMNVRCVQVVLRVLLRVPARHEAERLHGAGYARVQVGMHSDYSTSFCVVRSR